MAFAPTPSSHEFPGRSAIAVRHWELNIDRRIPGKGDLAMTVFSGRLAQSIVCAIE